MPRVTLLQTNFTAGEISPKCYGRTDVARYQNGAEVLENCIVNIHGGAQRRPGKRFVAATKKPAARSRLIPYIFSTTQAYMLEFGDFYMRVYQQGGGQILVGGTPYEVTTPYSETMLSELDYTQGADTMFIFHPSLPIYSLKRFAPDRWVLARAAIGVEPFDEIGHRFGAWLTVSDPTVGPGRSLTISFGAFTSADVGRIVSYESGRAIITSVPSATQAYADITLAFPGISAAPYAWVLEGSPRGTMVPSAKSPIGATISLNFETSLVVEPAKQIESLLTTITGGVTAQVSGHGYVTGNTVVISGCEPAEYNGTFSITVDSPNTFVYSLSMAPGDATVLGTAARQAAVAAVAGWRSEDVGKFVRINGGLVQLTQVASQSQAAGVLKQELSSVVGAPADAWTLEAPVWNPFNGYPRTGALYEQRLIAAGTLNSPQAVWGSRSGMYFDFTIGTNDDDAFSFSLPSTGQLNPITRMVSSSALLPLTYGGEYTMGGGIEKPLGPTNVQTKPRSGYGCNAVKPVRVGREIMFVQRAGRKVRAIAYDTDSGQYAAPDLTVLAEHITESGIVDMAYQQEPRSILWCVRADGKAATLTLDRDEGVTAWTSQTTDGQYESVAAIPSTGGDEVWAIVRRTINGAVVRYVERFDDALLSDAAITGASSEGAAVWAGLSHLEGKEVVAREGNTYLGRFTVSNGQIELPRAVNSVEIGLPYTSRVRLLRPEVPAGDGSAQGNNMRTHEVSVLLHETVGCYINDDEVSFRQFGSGLLDQAPPEFSGFERIGTTGWMRGDSPIEVSQQDPLPFHLLAVVRKFTVNS